VKLLDRRIGNHNIRERNGVAPVPIQDKLGRFTNVWRILSDSAERRVDMMENSSIAREAKKNFGQNI
jgi:hypothetical protein